MKDFKIIIIIVLALTSCFKKTESKLESRAQLAPIQEHQQKIIASPVFSSSPTAFLNKKQREAIYFAASLEKEALKVLTKNTTFDGPTLFSVLSYIVEANSGVKNKAPSPLDCSRFRIDTQPKNQKTLRILKVCQKPESLVAEIQTGVDSDTMTVRFFVKEWISVLGYSATLGGTEIKCDLKVLNKKLEYLNCEGWNRMLNLTASSAEELRLKTFIFDRQGAHQFVLKGGIFKDLVEHKKIEVYAPIEGKIKRIENEIEVIDQYLEMPVVSETRPARIKINPNPQERKPEPEGDPNEKESQPKGQDEKSSEDSQEDSQKNSREGRQEGNEKSSEKSSQNSNEAYPEKSSEKSGEGDASKGREENGSKVGPNSSGNQNTDPINGGIPPGPGR